MKYRRILLSLLLFSVGCTAFEDPALKAFNTRSVAAAGYKTSPGFENEYNKTRQTLPADLNATAGPPFIIIGDYPRSKLVQIRDRVILPVAAAYWSQFMRRRPRNVFRVYLLSNTELYYATARRIIGHKPVSKLGLYSLQTHSLFADTGMGYGWLCHELWHALVDCDFPGIPSWLDEGMASLFEEPELDGARIRGRHNWRLWVLRQYMGAGKYVPLKKLIRLRGTDFYLNPLRPLCYAEARYVCFYLQEQGSLSRFYRQFRDNYSRDPTGVRALCAAGGVKSIAEFEKNWLAWIRKLPESAGAN